MACVDGCMITTVSSFRVQRFGNSKGRREEGYIWLWSLLRDWCWLALKVDEWELSIGLLCMLGFVAFLSFAFGLGGLGGVENLKTWNADGYLFGCFWDMMWWDLLPFPHRFLPRPPLEVPWSSLHPRRNTCHVSSNIIVISISSRILEIWRCEFTCSQGMRFGRYLLKRYGLLKSIHQPLLSLLYLPASPVHPQLANPTHTTKSIYKTPQPHPKLPTQKNEKRVADFHGVRHLTCTHSFVSFPYLYFVKGFLGCLLSTLIVFVWCDWCDLDRWVWFE